MNGYLSVRHRTGIGRLMVRAGLLIAFALGAGAQTASAYSTTRTVDSSGGVAVVGEYTSLQLDSAGNPVISYRDVTNGGLKLAHCNDPVCDPDVNGPESIQVVDSAGSAGHSTSLALDSDGNPVISYSSGSLMLAHCNDPDCDPSANGPESIQVVDGAVSAHFASLLLNASGFPRISYYDAGSQDLKLALCNDVSCDPGVNGPETIHTEDSAGDVGMYSSLAVNPYQGLLIAYLDATHNTLKVARCLSSDCNPATTGIYTVGVASHPGGISMKIDSSGRPVIAHFTNEISGGYLKLAYCNDASCDPANGAETIQIIERASPGQYDNDVSLALDASGFPVIAYQYTIGDGSLKLARCNDASCNPAVNGVETIQTLDLDEANDLFPSLALDADGYPVISYYKSDLGTLDLVHCDSAACTVPLTHKLTAAMYCVDSNLDVYVSMGDAPLQLTGNGPGLPAGRDNLGNIYVEVFPGGAWTSLTVSEVGGDHESIDLGDITCGTPAAGEPPRLRTPKNGAAVLTHAPNLTWTRGKKGVTGYHVQVDDNADFSSPTQADLDVTVPRYRTDFLDFGVYSWRVYFKSTNGPSAYSEPFTFEVTLLKSPKAGKTLRTHTPTFRWQKVLGAPGYQIEIGTDETFAGAIPIDTRRPFYKVPKLMALPPGDYFWRVSPDGLTWTLGWPFTIRE